MRILVLNWRDTKSKDYGGAERTAETIAKRLSERGHMVTLFTSVGGSSRTGRIGKVEVIRGGSINTVYLFAFAHMLRNRSRYDIVMESVSTMPFFSTLLFEQSRVFVLVHHIMGKHIFSATHPLKAIAAGVAESSIPFFYRNANFVTLSKFVRSQLMERGISPSRIRTFYLNYIRIDGGSMRKEKKPTLVTVGRMVRQKRVNMLIALFSRLVKEKKIDAKLIVVGRGREGGRLKRMCARLGISSRVRFTGFVNEKEKVSLLKSSWVFATTSLIEGYGLSALEAEACGIPVVAFANGGLRESVRNNRSGFLVKEGDDDAYIEKLCRLLSDTRLRERMGRNARRHSLSMGGSGLDRFIEELEHAAAQPKPINPYGNKIKQVKCPAVQEQCGFDEKHCR